MGCFLSLAFAGCAADISTYGTNTPEWNAKLNLSALRMACKGAPKACIQRLDEHATTQQVAKVCLNIFLDEPSVEKHALEYSGLSMDHPALQEIGVDDFASAYYHLFKDHRVADPASFLRTVIKSVKSKNPNLKFGVTLYEDELTSPFLRDARLPADTKGEIDFVHLYVHYRTNGPAYEGYLDEVRKLFPHAQVIAGAYAYDRIDYATCVKGGPPCTREEETDLFKKSFEVQADLLKTGAIAAIEFYPANFGLEEEWAGWKDPRKCSATRKRECIGNTKAMRMTALEILQSGRLVK